VGSTDECVNGAICTFVGDGSECHQICELTTECPNKWICTGVSNSGLRACVPDN
jgi:hypothetical protein